MPNAAQREAQVGTLTAALIFGSLGLAFFGPSTSEDRQDQGLELTAEFGRIDGLALDSPVRMAGIHIGSVVKTSLTDQHRAKITILVSDPDILIPSDTAAVIETDGVFGEKYVELHPGGEFDGLSSGQNISYSQDSVVLENLLNQIVARANAETDAAENMGGTKP